MKKFNSGADLAKEIEIEPVSLTRADIDLMIWEVDDDIDGFVSWPEYMKMYKRCWEDT